MKNLIKALTILSKYTESEYVTSCEHDVLYVYIDPGLVSEEDRMKLASLGFDADYSSYNFTSFAYGSC
jgi:hypothetical protein